MIYKSYLVLFVCFFVQNLATGMNLHDLSSIEIFINSVHKRAWSYYQVENGIINGDEKEDILKVIFYDFTKILTELNNMSADSRNVLSSGGLVSLISTLEKFDRKNGSFLSSKLSDKLTKIFNISETINLYIEPLLQLGTNNISDIEDVLKFCPTDANAGQNDQFKYEKQIILKEYREFVEKLTTEIKYKNKSNTCGLTTSLNEAIFVYFHNVIATYLKEYVLLYFIDIIDTRCLDLKAAPILTFRRNETLIELNKSIKLTKKFLATSNYNIHNCDADYKNTIGEPYYELKGMIETMIIAEEDMTINNDCYHNCDLTKIRYYLKYDQCQEYGSCKYIGDKIDFCRVPDKWSLNRYQWIKGDDTIYGSGYPHCNKTIGTISSSYSWWPPFSNCDFCVCTCKKKPKSAINTTPAISFREHVTDIDNNMIIVGLRFVEKNELIQIQAKERKLRVRSSEDKASWKKLEDIHHNSPSKGYHIKNPDLSFSTQKEVDYGWTDNMNLDDLIAPKGYVVTGVRLKPAEMFFEKASIMKTGSIQLQIRVTPFDYTEGVLVNKNKTHWIKKSDYFQKHLLPLDNRDKPTKSPGNKIDSKPDQYVSFRSSDLEKDAGLSTVPFFDAQHVEGDPEFPLGGVGLVHRGHKGYGGFLALKIYDLNLSMYFNDKSNTVL